MTPPGSCHHTAAATTIARPKRKSPTPSRRWSGSRSRADCPIDRATAPTAWAMPSQTAATPRPSAPKPRATGPGPLRTARGAGRAAGRREDALDRLRLFAEDVLELRDPGGEDVRLAMLRPYGQVTPVTRITVVRVVRHRARRVQDFPSNVSAAQKHTLGSS